MNTLPASTAFVNILVSVKPNATEPGKYDILTAPAVPVITEPDTVISYQIFDSGNIVFTGVSILPDGNDQLSPPSISLSGKLLTFSDANTKQMDLNVTLMFTDTSKPKLAFSHDPQISNRPPV